MRFRVRSIYRRSCVAWPFLRLTLPLLFVVVLGVGATGFLLRTALQFISADNSSPSAVNLADSPSARRPMPPSDQVRLRSQHVVAAAWMGEAGDVAAGQEARRGFFADGGPEARTRPAAQGVAKPARKRAAEPAKSAAAKAPVTYRTVCVRACDGGYFPISYSTTPQYFARDAAACISRCGVPARLYVYPTRGGSPESMVDLNGQPYSALANANVFKSERRAGCSCRPSAPLPLEAKNEHDLPIAGDPGPVIGGIDTDPADRPAVDPRFEAPLKAATSVYDATGRAVALKPHARGAAKPAVTLIARAAEPVETEVAAAAPLETAALPRQEVSEQTAGAVAVQELPLPGTAKLAGGKHTTGKARKIAAANKAQRKLALERLALASRPALGVRTASGDDVWYGRRMFTGKDWRLVTFQTLE